MGRPPIPTDELLDDLRRVADKLDKIPSQDDYNEHGSYSRLTIKNRFGTWVSGLEEAGFDVSDRRGVSEYDG